MVEEDIAEEAANKPKKKGTTIKTRKSLTRKLNGNYGDSDDEDYWSKLKTKKAGGSKREDDGGAKARVAANKAKIAAAAAVFGASDDEEEEPRRNRILLNAPPSEPSDLEMKPAPKAKLKTTQKGAPPKKTAPKRRR